MDPFTHAQRDTGSVSLILFTREFDGILVCCNLVSDHQITTQFWTCHVMASQLLCHEQNFVAITFLELA